MSTIVPKTQTIAVSYEDETIPICWNKRENVTHKRTEKVHQKLGIYQSGPDKELLGSLIKLIEKAKKVVCISSFVIQPGELTDTLLAAAKRGVRVYLITASEKHFKKEVVEMGDFDERVYKEHIALLDGFAGRIMVRTADHFHSKFILADPGQKSGAGFLLTANLTLGALYENVFVNGIEYPCNFELGIRLSSQQVNDVYAQFLRGFWEQAEHELFTAGKLAGVGKSPFEKFPHAKVLKWTIGNETPLKEDILRLLDSATSSITISSWSFQNDHETVKKLIEKAKGGVRVLVLARSHHYNMEALSELMNHGAQILGHFRLHGKFLIVDEQEGMIMTSNLTSLGLDGGFESGLVLEKAQITQILKIYEEWARCCEWVLSKDMPRKSINGEALTIDEEELRRTPVKPEFVETHIINARNMEEFMDPKMDKPVPQDDVIYLAARSEYTINPPVLPKKAQPVTEEGLPKNKAERERMTKIMEKFPLYQRKGKRFLVVKDTADIPLAMEFAKEPGLEIVVKEQ